MQRTVDPHYSSVVSPATSRGALADPVLITNIDGIRTNGWPLPPAALAARREDVKSILVSRLLSPVGDRRDGPRLLDCALGCGMLSG